MGNKNSNGNSSRSNILWIVAGIYLLYSGFTLVRDAVNGVAASSPFIPVAGVAFLIIGAGLLFAGAKNSIKAQKDEEQRQEAQSRRGVLVVSFGTSYDDTRAKTIDKIEDEIRAVCPENPFYTAWTSSIIRRKLQERDGVHVNDVQEALAEMKKDGIREVIVQPTFILRGHEFDKMKEQFMVCEGDFDKVTICDSLIMSEEDERKIAELLAEEYHLTDDEVLLFMGHGTDHAANVLYGEMNRIFEETGHGNMVMGTVEGDFSIENFVEKMKEVKPKKILLAPFMIVAGDHACNDMAGDDEDSWKNILEKEGYEVECFIKGLGEMETVRKLFAEHTQAVL